MTATAVVRVRHSRTPCGISLATLSFAAGAGGTAVELLRSPAVAIVAPTALAGWYILLLAGSLLLVYALTSPQWRDYATTSKSLPPVLAPLTRDAPRPRRWRRHLHRAYTTTARTVIPAWRRALAPVSQPWAEVASDTTYAPIMIRLYCEQIGLYIVGWQWFSYGAAAIARQGATGYTACCLGWGFALYTCLRLIQLHYDTKGLRAWRQGIRTATEED